MPVTKFPDPRRATAEGIVALGGDLHPESLLLAYSQGIFPWPMEGIPELVWFCPPERTVLELENLHVPRSLEKKRRQAPFRLTRDQAFREVIEACARTPRPDQRGTWITPEMLEAYVRMHELGYAHSVEAWAVSGLSPDAPSKDDRLVGGIYGLEVGGVFSAESMFHRETDASKLALLHLVEHLGARGLDWIDVQVMTPHLERLGARDLSRDEFLRKLARTREAHELQGRPSRFGPPSPDRPVPRP